MTPQSDIRSKIAYLINEKVDWAEWGKDNSEGYDLSDAILSLLQKRIEAKLPKKISMKYANNTGSEAGWGVTRGHNDCLKDVRLALRSVLKGEK